MSFTSLLSQHNPYIQSRVAIRLSRNGRGCNLTLSAPLTFSHVDPGTQCFYTLDDSGQQFAANVQSDVVGRTVTKGKLCRQMSIIKFILERIFAHHIDTLTTTQSLHQTVFIRWKMMDNRTINSLKDDMILFNSIVNLRNTIKWFDKLFLFHNMSLEIKHPVVYLGMRRCE